MVSKEIWILVMDYLIVLVAIALVAIALMISFLAFSFLSAKAVVDATLDGSKFCYWLVIISIASAIFVNLSELISYILDLIK